MVMKKVLEATRSFLSRFQYSGSSKIRILHRMIILGLYRICRVRYVDALVNGHRMCLDLGTPGLSRTLFIYGTREILDTYVVRKEVGGSMNVLEVGANIGYYALLEASLLEGGCIYALEPDPRNISLLKKNIELNHRTCDIKIYPYAASNLCEQRDFYLGERTNVSSFVGGRKNTGVTRVDCIKLDDFPDIEKIDFIRMDVEGYECKVLEGMSNLLSKNNKPLKIFIELHMGAYNQDDLNFRKHFVNLLREGFRVKYLIISRKHRDSFYSAGYTAVFSGVETRFVRDLYKDVDGFDALRFFDAGFIRSVLFERV